MPDTTARRVVRHVHLQRAARALTFAAGVVDGVLAGPPPVVELLTDAGPYDVVALAAAAAALRLADADLAAAEPPEVTGVNDRGETVQLAAERLGVPDAVR